MHLTAFQTLAAKWARTATINARPITVTFSGQTAFTESNHINLPQFPSGTLLTPAQLSLFNGYLDHERSHIAYTDFEILNSQKLMISPPLKALWNIFEDIFVENKCIKEFPGSRKYLDHLCHEVDKSIAIPPGAAIPPVLLIYQEAYAKYRGVDTGKIPNKLTTHHPQIAETMKQLASCQSTQDALELARKVLALLETEERAEIAEIHTKQHSGFKPTTVGQPTERTESSNGENSLGDHNGIGNRGMQLEDDNQLPTQSLETQAATILSLQNSTNKILENLIETTKDSNSLPRTPKGQILPPITTHDRVWITPETTNPQRFETLKQSVTPEISQLKKSLQLYLMSRAKRAWLRGLTDGEILDRERLHHITLPGTPDVFKTRHQRMVINTAIELTIDLSGSMDGALTAQAAIIIAETLSSIEKLKLAITGFTTGGGNPRPDRSRKGIGRLSPLKITLFKDFDTPYAKARPALGTITNESFTPLGDAYAKALEHILPRKEPRKIIWLISDGTPEFNVGDDRHDDHLLMANIHQKAKRLGIETLGVEINQRNLLTPYVDHAVFIHQPSDLPRALLQTVKKMVNLVRN